MRSRHGVRKRRYGVFLGFDLFVFRLIARKTRHFLNKSRRRTERRVPSHGAVPPLRRGKIPTHVPLFHRRRRGSDDHAGQSLRNRLIRQVFPLPSLVQLRNLLIRGLRSLFLHSELRRSGFENRLPQGGKEFPHFVGWKGPYRQLRRIRTLRLHRRKPRHSGTRLENAFGIKKSPPAYGGDFRP